MNREPMSQISSESLLDAIALLGLEEENIMWQLVDEDLIQAEEELWEQDPDIWAEIQEARAVYQLEDDLAS